MAKISRAVRNTSSALAVLVSLVAWITGLLVALAVGFGMILGTLSVPAIPEAVTSIAGWIVVILAILGALLAIVEKLSR